MRARITYEVSPMPAYHGKRTRYGITYTVARTNFILSNPVSGRLRSFATMSGAQRVCDRLNADEHKRVSG